VPITHSGLPDTRNTFVVIIGAIGWAFIVEANLPCSSHGQ